MANWRWNAVRFCAAAVWMWGLGSGTMAAQTAAAVADAQKACASDIQKLCANVPSGGGRILACLKQHQDQVSDGCRQAVIKALGGPAQPAAPAAAKPPAAPVAPSTPPPAAAPKAPGAASGAAPAGTPPGRYLLMKKVKIIDQAAGQGRPAYDLLIPTAWNFKGWVNGGIATGGCLADWFSVFGDATSPDNSMELQLLPQDTWQYADDPRAVQQMQQQNQKDAQVKLKPCPVHPPQRAEEYLRQYVIPQYFKTATVVSVSPFPELEQNARHQLGLPPASAGGNTGEFRSDAARARITYTDEKGNSVEAWLAVATVTHAVPSGGRGSFYDARAVMPMLFRAPKGQLDANDRIFKLMVSSIQPEADWRNWSNGVIATLYRKRQEELAKQQAMIAAFQQHVADTINGVTANAMAGANHAAFGQDQLVRGVQTFRDPSTGATYELSNLYDHAWMNGSDQYVMTDDATFNPNGNLTGNWNKLEVVR